MELETKAKQIKAEECFFIICEEIIRDEKHRSRKANNLCEFARLMCIFPTDNTQNILTELSWLRDKRESYDSVFSNIPKWVCNESICDMILEYYDKCVMKK
jgi:hypothetical protein